MLQIDYRDRSPLYEQIRDGIKELIMKGVLKPDERIPSVREQSQTLTINPNTIQKAYKELEDKGYIYSIRGKGSFVSPSCQWKDEKKIDELFQSLDKIVTDLLLFGAEKERIIEKVNNLFRQEEGGK